MSKIGTFVLIKIGGKLLIGQNSASLKDAITMIETSNKTSGNSSTFEYGRNSATLAVGGIASTSKEATEAGYHELRASAMAHTKVTFSLGEFTNEGAASEVSGTEKYTGTALISGLTWDNPDNDKQTFSCDLQVDGDLTVATSAGGVEAPTGDAAQTFANGATVADLVAVGTTIKWYAAASGGTALATSTALVTATHYYASQTVGGVESTARLDVTVTLT